MKEILFLTLAEVVDIHSNQIRLYGGLPGIRDIIGYCNAPCIFSW